MAKNKSMGKTCSSCGSCCKSMAWVVLILGILLLARDLGYNYIGSISAWSLVFLVIGIKCVKKASCNTC